MLKKHKTINTFFDAIRCEKHHSIVKRCSFRKNAEYCIRLTFVAWHPNILHQLDFLVDIQQYILEIKKKYGNNNPFTWIAISGVIEEQSKRIKLLGEMNGFIYVDGEWTEEDTMMKNDPYRI
jgi:hypothetical protein